MSDYPAPADVEGPEEVNPAFIAKDWRAEVLIKDPSCYIQNTDGTQTHLVPEAQWLVWGEVPLVADPSNCGHGFSMCMECADSWGTDYWIRFIERTTDAVIWISPDHPDAGGDQGENPPLYNIN